MVIFHSYVSGLDFDIDINASGGWRRSKFLLMFSNQEMLKWKDGLIQHDSCHGQIIGYV
jgi:hypothetical protein